jgi:pimeloyl-ACP methyl ester carboxylesterase
MTSALNDAIQPRFRTIDGLSTRDALSASRDAHALLLSPRPESRYCYEPTWTRLAKHTHLVAVDLPGFGQSERRNALMSPSAMGEFVVRVADACGLEQPHVVGPDVGTGASLFAAARYPGRFRSLDVGTGGAAVPRQLGGVLKAWVEAPSLAPYPQIDGRQMVTAALGTLERYRPTEAAREDSLASYAGERFAESMRYVRTDPEQLPVLRDLLPTIATLVLIIAGAQDPVVPPVKAALLHERLPTSTPDLLDALHCIWEDAAAQYAALVTRWWAGGYATAGGGAGA